MQTKNVFSIIKNGFQLRSLLMFFWLVENNQSHFDARLSINTSMTDELSLKFSNESVVHLTSLIEKPRQFSPLFATDFAPEIYCNGLPPFRWNFEITSKNVPKSKILRALSKCTNIPWVILKSWHFFLPTIQKLMECGEFLRGK